MSKIGPKTESMAASRYFATGWRGRWRRLPHDRFWWLIWDTVYTMRLGHCGMGVSHAAMIKKGLPSHALIGRRLTGYHQFVPEEREDYPAALGCKNADLLYSVDYLAAGELGWAWEYFSRAGSAKKYCRRLPANFPAFSCRLYPNGEEPAFERGCRIGSNFETWAKSLKRLQRELYKLDI